MGDTQTRRDTERLEAVLKALRSVEGDLGLPLLMTLLIIAQRPGLSINDLAKEIDAPQQTASRYVSILQGRYQSPGTVDSKFSRHPHVSLEISDSDPRRRALYLTAHGMNRVAHLLRLIYKPEQASR